MNITPSDVRVALGAAAVLGGGGFALARFAPIDNQWQNGLPKGGPLDAHDWQATAAFGTLGLGGGVALGLMGAASANAPKSALGGAMLLGSLGAAALGVGLALGAGLRD